MPSFDSLLTFFLAVSIFAFIPGPGMLYAAGQTMAGGRAVGLMGVTGLAVGGYLHVIAAAAGLSVIFHAVPVLYAMVKLGGAAYLIWLGFGILRRKTAGIEEVQVQIPKTGQRAFVQGITVEVLNPKTALFFVAFLPQFTDPSTSLPVWAQFLLMGSIVNVVFALSDVAAVLLASTIATRLSRTNRVQRAVQRVSGGILIALGLRLALEKN